MPKSKSVVGKSLKVKNRAFPSLHKGSHSKGDKGGSFPSVKNMITQGKGKPMPSLSEVVRKSKGKQMPSFHLTKK